MRVRSILAAAALALVTGTEPASGRESVWSPIGPYGGDIMSLTIDPADPLTIYAGTGQSGMFASRDGGEHWTQFGAFPGRQVCGLALDPGNPDVSYAVVGCAGGGGAFRTADGGVHWSQLHVGGIGNGPLETVVVDPTTPTTLYAALDPGGVFKSIDSGANWTPTGGGVIYPSTRALAIDPADPRTVYAGSSRGGLGVSWPNQGGIYKTTDAGGVWQEMNVGLPDGFAVHAIVVDPSVPGTVYVATNVGLFKSTDAAASWSAADPGRAEIAISAVAIDPSAPQTLYAVSSTACYACPSEVSRSSDGGMHWVPLQITAPADPVQTIAVAADGTVYAGSLDGGVFKSGDRGTTWRAAARGLTATSVRTLAAAPGTPSIVYAGLRRGVVARTDGSEWRDASTGLADPNVRFLAVAPSLSTTLYAVNGGSVSATIDAAATWTATAPVPDPNVVAIDPTSPATVYAGTQTGMFKSADAGAHWSAINNGLNPFGYLCHPTPSVATIAIDPSAPSTVYAGYFCENPEGVRIPVLSHLVKTTDGGDSWMAAEGGLNTYWRVVVADPVTPGTLYAGTPADVLKSVDGGASWAPAGGGLPTATSVNALAIDPITPTTLYAGTGLGVFQSTDGGATWTALNAGLTPRTGPYPGVTALVVDPARPSKLYAATSSNGVFVLRPACAGDCGGDGVVTITDLVTGIDIALGLLPLDACPSFDGTENDAITVDELIAAVFNALHGCSGS